MNSTKGDFWGELSLSLYLSYSLSARESSRTCAAKTIFRNATMSDETMVFVGVCKLDLMGKGKKGWAENQQQPVALSPRSTKQLFRLCSQLRTGWIWPNKRETERKFHPIPADKRVLFQQLMSFLLEKCENLDWLKETRNLFLPALLFFFVFEAHSRAVL